MKNIAHTDQLYTPVTYPAHNIALPGQNKLLQLNYDPGSSKNYFFSFLSYGEVLPGSRMKVAMNKKEINF